MNKIRLVNAHPQIILNTYLLTITYRFSNNYTAKTFSFTSLFSMLQEYDKLLSKYPYLVRKSINAK